VWEHGQQAERTTVVVAVMVAGVCDHVCISTSRHSPQDIYLDMPLNPPRVEASSVARALQAHWLLAQQPPDLPCRQRNTAVHCSTQQYTAVHIPCCSPPPSHTCSLTPSSSSLSATALRVTLHTRAMWGGMQA
jgi:hypothetical protein